MAAAGEEAVVVVVVAAAAAGSGNCRGSCFGGWAAIAMLNDVAASAYIVSIFIQEILFFASKCVLALAPVNPTYVAQLS